MNAAKEDLHEIFFNMPTYQRIALVKQSEKVLACQRDRQVCIIEYFYYQLCMTFAALASINHVWQ